MTGLPGLAEIRSLSKFALSQITVVFQDDVDIYFARQLVLERIMAAKERLTGGDRAGDGACDHRAGRGLSILCRRAQRATDPIPQSSKRS